MHGSTFSLPLTIGLNGVVDAVLHTRCGVATGGVGVRVWEGRRRRQVDGRSRGGGCVETPRSDGSLVASEAAATHV